MQQQIRGSELIPLVQPHRRFLFSSLVTVTFEARRQLPAFYKRISRSLVTTATQGSTSELMPESAYVLTKRAVDKPFIIFRFTDVVLQGRQLNDKTFELVRWVEIPERVAADDDEDIFPGKSVHAQPMIELSNECLRIVFADAVIYATGKNEELRRWR